MPVVRWYVEAGERRHDLDRGAGERERARVRLPCAWPFPALEREPRVGKALNETVRPLSNGLMHASGQSIRYGSLRT